MTTEATEHLRPETEIIFKDARPEFDGEVDQRNLCGLETKSISVGVPEDVCRPFWGGIRTVDECGTDPVAYLCDGKIFVTPLGLDLLKAGLAAMKSVGAKKEDSRE